MRLPTRGKEKFNDGVRPQVEICLINYSLEKLLKLLSCERNFLFCLFSAVFAIPPHKLKFRTNYIIQISLLHFGNHYFCKRLSNWEDNNLGRTDK